MAVDKRARIVDLRSDDAITAVLEQDRITTGLSPSPGRTPMRRATASP